MSGKILRFGSQDNLILLFFLSANKNTELVTVCRSARIVWYDSNKAKVNFEKFFGSNLARQFDKKLEFQSLWGVSSIGCF